MDSTLTTEISVSADGKLVAFVAFGVRCNVQLRGMRSNSISGRPSEQTTRTC
jgi:hypothetical protein